MFDIGLIIGRFQPVHLGHIALITDALSKCEEIVVIIGTDSGERTPKNPFLSYERMDMIESCISKEDIKRVHFYPIRDHGNIVTWTQEVRDYVQTLYVSEDGDPVGLFGFKKDETSYYLDHFPEYTSAITDMAYNGCVNSTEIRVDYFKNGVIDETNLHPNVQEYLNKFRIGRDELFECNYFNY